MSTTPPVLQQTTPRITTRLDPAELRTQEQYKLMAGSVIPRPIALVTTLGPNGPNAAPFSFFNAIGVKPPMVMFSVGPREGAEKDTVRNLRHLPEFVVHIVDYASAEKMNICATEFPAHINEIERAGFHYAPSEKVAPPRLLDCPVQMECRVIEMREMGRLPYVVVFGEVLLFHFHEGIVDDRLNVDAARIDAVGRLAGTLNYTRIDNRFGMPILPVPEADKR